MLLVKPLVLFLLLLLPLPGSDLPAVEGLQESSVCGLDVFTIQLHQAVSCCQDDGVTVLAASSAVCAGVASNAQLLQLTQ